MKLVGKSKTQFVPSDLVLAGAPTTGAGLIVPRTALDAAPVLILPDHIVDERREEESRPWTTIETLYQEVRGATKMSRGKFKAQLRKMINRGLVEIKYPTKRESEYGAVKMVRPSKAGRKEATDVVE